MNPPPLTSLRKALPLLVTGVMSGGLGWALNDFVTPPRPIPRSVSIAASPISSSPSGQQSTGSGVPASAGTVRHGEDEAASSKRSSEIVPTVLQVVERVSTADTSDMTGLMESIGVMTRMSDGEIRMSWAELAKRPPVGGFGNSLAAFYLWSRMNRMGENVTLPKGWGAENYEVALQLEKARRNIPELLGRIGTAEGLSDVERRVVFSDAMQTDPLKAVKLWCQATKPGDYYYDGKWFGEALSNPQTRDAIMAEVRNWQRGGDVAGATIAMARNWISRDPAAVEAWLKEPGQADVRDVVLREVANMRVLSNPAAAWTWSQSLPQSERRYTMGMSAAHLANDNPQAGARLIAELSDPAERATAVQEYGRILAGNNFSQWEQWRETLPEKEREVANQAAFGFWAFHDVDQAVQWLNAQPVGDGKYGMVATLVDIYAARDPGAAARWIESIPDRERRREAATAALTTIGTGNLESMRTILNAVGN